MRSTRLLSTTASVQYRTDDTCSPLALKANCWGGGHTSHERYDSAHVWYGYGGARTSHPLQSGAPLHTLHLHRNFTHEGMKNMPTACTDCKLHPAELTASWPPQLPHVRAATARANAHTARARLSGSMSVTTRRTSCAGISNVGHICCAHTGHVRPDRSTQIQRLSSLQVYSVEHASTRCSTLEPFPRPG